MVEITTISKEQYDIERKLVNRANALVKDMAPLIHENGGAIPDAVANHPYYKMVDNDMRGRVEQFELHNMTPIEFVAYLGEPEKNGMGVDRVIAQTYPVTVWTGLPIGNATKGSTWGVRSAFGTHMSQYYARVNGREFTGRGFGVGMAIVFRETAESKRLHKRTSK